MALTLTQKDALATNATFLGRVRQAIRQHATYLIALPGTQTQLDWAAHVFWAARRCDQMAADMAGELTTQPNVANSETGDGSDVTDANLQAAVDAICEKYQ